MVNSIGGIIVGIVLTICSLIGLFINEGTIDYSKVAQNAVPLTTEAPNPNANGKLVTLSGKIQPAPPIGDNQYLKPGGYAILARTVEMYAWKETKSTTTQKNPGGSETKTTNYRYTKEWTDNPKPSSSFHKSNFRNPEKPISNQTLKASTAKIGSYDIAMDNLQQVVHYPPCLSGSKSYSPPEANGGITLPKTSRVLLTPEMILPTQAKLVDSYLFQGVGTPQSPQVGDLRICYAALNANSMATALGKLQANCVVPASYSQKPLFRLISGDRQSAIAELKSEYQLWL